MYYSKVVFFIMGIIKNHNAAKDLAQDVFVNIWVNRSKLDATSNLSNYIFVSSRNTAINYLKKEATFPHSPIEAEQLNISIGNTGENNLFAKEISLLIEMSREQGLNNEEIANILKISQKTVENQISTALKDIRRAISMYLIFMLYMLS